MSALGGQCYREVGLRNHSETMKRGVGGLWRQSHPQRPSNLLPESLEERSQEVTSTQSTQAPGCISHPEPQQGCSGDQGSFGSLAPGSDQSLSCPVVHRHEVLDQGYQSGLSLKELLAYFSQLL